MGNDLRNYVVFKNKKSSGAQGALSVKCQLRSRSQGYEFKSHKKKIGNPENKGIKAKKKKNHSSLYINGKNAQLEKNGNSGC